MDLQAFIKSVKIETKPVQLRGNTLFVRKLTTLELNDCFQLAEKWQAEREKKLGVKESETIMVKVPVKDSPGSFADVPFKTAALAFQIRCKAVMCLSLEDGKQWLSDVKQIAELVYGDGKLSEDEVREIEKVYDLFESKPEEKIKEEKEADEKN